MFFNLQSRKPTNQESKGYLKIFFVERNCNVWMLELFISLFAKNVLGEKLHLFGNKSKAYIFFVEI